MRVWGCLPLMLFLILLALLPLVFGQLFATALMKLRLEPSTAILLVMGIILGGGINIPLKRIARNHALVEDPLAIVGLTGRWPWFQRARHETVIAVNVGGCLILAGLAIYEIAHLLFESPQSLPWLAIAVAVDTAVCYRLAQPISGIGIALPGLVPAAVAAVSAFWLVPEQAPRKSHLSREWWVPSSAPMCSTSVTSRRLRPESPVSEVPGRLMGLSSPESSPPIWHEQRRFHPWKHMEVAPLLQSGADFPISPRWTEE